ncbi:MAG: hypothetical protein WC365_04470 [Candidatus Babeliales bacterium]|jgi:hypothetical protein
MEIWSRRLSVLAFMFALMSYWSSRAMQLPSINDDARIIDEIKKMEKELQPVPDQFASIRDLASRHLDMLFDAYRQLAGDERANIDVRIGLFIRNLPEALQSTFFDKFNNIQAQLLAIEKNPITRLKNMNLQAMQQEVASEVWGAAQPLAEQKITHIIERKIDTPEFRGLKLCLRAATGSVAAEEWFADLPKEQDFASNDREMQKLIRELKENNDDVVVLIVGAVTNALQSAPLFLFNNFAPFKNKKATIILVTGAYSNLSKEEQDGLAEGIGKIIGEKITINDNEITFGAASKYSNISMKFFGTIIPDRDFKDCKHPFYGYWRRFCQKQMNDRKNIFIGWMADIFCCNTSLGLSNVYMELKDQYPDNIFFYGTASYRDDCFIIFDPLAWFKPHKPLAQRFFTLGFRSSPVESDFDASKISRIVNIKRPFLICQSLNFVFEEESNRLKVSLQDTYASKSKQDFYWKQYWSDRTSSIENFIWKLHEFVRERAIGEITKLGSALQVDTEPATWKEAVEKSGFMSWDEYQQKVVPN